MTAADVSLSAGGPLVTIGLPRVDRRSVDTDVSVELNRALGAFVLNGQRPGPVQHRERAAAPGRLRPRRIAFQQRRRPVRFPGVEGRAGDVRHVLLDHAREQGGGVVRGRQAHPEEHAALGSVPGGAVGEGVRQRGEHGVAAFAVCRRDPGHMRVEVAVGGGGVEPSRRASLVEHGRLGEVAARAGRVVEAARDPAQADVQRVEADGEEPDDVGEEEAGRGARDEQSRPGAEDEPGGIGLIEFVAFVVGRQRMVVEGCRRTPADRVTRPCGKAKPHLSRDERLGGRGERFDPAAQRRVPQALVNEVGPERAQASLLTRVRPLEHEVFEIAARRDERDRNVVDVDLVHSDEVQEEIGCRVHVSFRDVPSRRLERGLSAALIAGCEVPRGRCLDGLRIGVLGHGLARRAVGVRLVRRRTALRRQRHFRPRVVRRRDRLIPRLAGGLRGRPRG